MKINPAGSGPVTASTPIGFGDALPAAADVVVIGGGVAGVFSALYLARSGHRVVLVEKGRIAGEQSSRNWGWIRQTGRDPDELPVMMQAIKLWEEIDRECGGATGFKRMGTTYLASSEAEFVRMSAWGAVAKAAGLETRQLSAIEVSAMIDQGGVAWQGRAHGWVGAMHTPSDARAEPSQAVPAIARLAQKSGVCIVENCAARALDMAAGRIAGVFTEYGRVAANKAVLAGGAWSSLFLRRHGVIIPQLCVRASVARTVPLANVGEANCADEAMGWRRRADGGYTLAPSDFHEFLIGPDALRHFWRFLPTLKHSLGVTRLLPAAPLAYPDAWATQRHWDEDAASPFEAMRVLDPAPNAKAIAGLQAKFAARFPHLGVPAIAGAWAGMIDTMPDIVPVIDRAAKPEGLVIATGLSGHGFGIGPGVGRIVADLVGEQRPVHDLTRFRLSRFSDGSKMRLGPSI